MTKNGKRNVLIGTVSAACIAMICVIGSQFIDTDNIKIVSHNAPGTDKVSAAISTTAPIIAEEGNAETTAPADSADTTRPAEGSGIDDTTATNDDIIIVAVTTTTAGNYTYPSGGMVTDAAATTAAYTTKSMVARDRASRSGSVGHGNAYQCRDRAELRSGADIGRGNDSASDYAQERRNQR